MKSFGRGWFAVCVSGLVYGLLFAGYRFWAVSTEADRPSGVPAWDFLYPTQSPVQSAAFRIFYPCIRLDQWLHRIGESPDA